MTKAKQALLDMLNCVVCLESMGDQKLLSCQHTVCIECVGRIETRNGRLKCPVCNKESTIPDGKVENFPSSVKHKELASIVNGQSNNVPNTVPVSDNQDRSAVVSTDNSQARQPNKKTSNTRDVAANPLFQVVWNFGSVPKLHRVSSFKVATEKGNSLATNTSGKTKVSKSELEKLVKEIDEATEAGNKQLEHALQLLVHYGTNREVLDEHIRARKTEIETYPNKTKESYQEKLKALSNLSSERLKELEAHLEQITPHQCMIMDSLKQITELRKKLKRQLECSVRGELAGLTEVMKKTKSSLKELDLLLSQDILKRGVIERETVYSKGDQVRLNYACQLGDHVHQFVNGQITHISVGVIHGINPPRFPPTQEEVVISFEGKADWVGPVTKLCHTTAQSGLPLVGNRVRVKSRIKKAKFGLKGVKAKQSRGNLVQVKSSDIKDELSVVVDFPECRQWEGLYSEIELIPGCGFEVKDKVRVSRLIPEPSRGWAGVNGSSVGLITKIDGPAGKEEITVDFTECKNWVGVVSDLEIAREPSQRELVQVKLSVSEPLRGWGGIKHEDVGFLQRITQDVSQLCDVGHVMFPGRPEPWICKMSELEIVRYQEPDYGSHLAEEERLQAFRDNIGIAGRAGLVSDPPE